MSLAPVGLIALLARTKGFLDEDKRMDPAYVIKAAWTLPSADRRFRFTSSVLAHQHVLTQVYENNQLVFTSHDYEIKATTVTDYTELSKSLLMAASQIDSRKVDAEALAIAHFALLDLVDMQKSHSLWETWHASSERSCSMGSLTIQHSQSFFDMPNISVKVPGKATISFDSIIDNQASGASTDYLSEFHYTIQTKLKS